MALSFLASAFLRSTNIEKGKKKRKTRRIRQRVYLLELVQVKNFDVIIKQGTRGSSPRVDFILNFTTHDLADIVKRIAQKEQKYFSKKQYIPPYTVAYSCDAGQQIYEEQYDLISHRYNVRVTMQTTHHKVKRQLRRLKKKMLI